MTKEPTAAAEKKPTLKERFFCLVRLHSKRWLEIEEEFNENVGIIRCNLCERRYLHHEKPPIPGFDCPMNILIDEDTERFISTHYRK